MSPSLQAALARDRLGEYQAQAAIAALHADAPRVEETDWVQIVEWYDELLRFADTPIVRLNRAVAVGEADGAPAGLAALAEVDEHIPRRDAVAAHLHEKNGDLELAARLYADAARNAPNLAERDHQTRQAARLNQVLRQSTARARSPPTRPANRCRTSSRQWPVRSRCLHPGQQQGRRWPSSSSSWVRRMRRSRVVSCLASSTQQMNSLRAKGVMSFQASRAVALAISALRRSAGSSCTTPPGTGWLLLTAQR